MSKDVPQKNHELTASKKEKNINSVRKLKEEGYGIKQIARVTGLGRQTIRRYLNPNTSPIQGLYGVSRESALASFHEIIDKLIIIGQTFKNIEEHIRNIGYIGSASAICMCATKKGRLIEETIKSEVDK